VTGARRVFAMLAACLAPLKAGAAADPPVPEPGEGTNYAGRATVSATYTSGNTESERLYGDAELTARAAPYRYSLSGKVEQREDPALGDNSAWLAAANYDRFFSERQFGYGRASVEHDEAKDLEQRRALGVGYGVDLIDTPNARLSVRAGPEYVVVERIAGPGEEYPAAGWGIKASWRPRGGTLELFHEQDGFWNLEDTGVVTLRSKSGLRVPLVARLNATAQLNLDWEREPAPGRASTDRTLLLGVDYTW
jgi:putative salt-induced outer membrane protein YdiY